MKKNIIALLLCLLTAQHGFSQMKRIVLKADTFYLVPVWRLKNANIRFVQADFFEKENLQLRKSAENYIKMLNFAESALYAKEMQFSMAQQQLNNRQRFIKAQEQAIKARDREILRQKRQKYVIIGGSGFLLILAAFL